MAESPPISIRKRLFVFTGVFVLALVILGTVQHFVQLSRDVSALQRMETMLDKDDPGWRLEEIEAARPTVPDERNSAGVIVAAYALQPSMLFDQPFLELFAKWPPPVVLDAGRADALDKVMLSAGVAVIKARKLADMPEGRHRLIHNSKPYFTRLEDRQDTRAVASLLDFDARDLAQKGKLREALRSCRAMFNAGRSLDDELYFTSQMIRIICVSQAAGAVERTLALTEPPMEDLASLQKLVENEERHPGLAISLRGERALHHVVFRGVAEGTFRIQDLPQGKDSLLALRERWAGWTLRRKACGEMPMMLDWFTRAIDNARRLPLHEQAAAEKALQDEIRKLGPDSLLHFFAYVTARLGEAFRRKIALMRCLSVVLALERHRQDKGDWPAKLEEVTPKLLKEVPLDPFDGKALRYLRLGDGVLVYSVGPDGIDNGGKIDRENPANPGTDLGYQLWDVKHRRQPAGKAK